MTRPIAPSTVVLPVRETYERAPVGKTRLPVWVMVGFVAVGAGLWFYQRNRARQADRLLSQRELLLRAAQLAVRVRVDPRAVSAGEILGTASQLIRLRSASETSAPPTPQPNPRRVISRVRSLDSPQAEPRARVDSLLELATLIAPVSETTERLAWQEVVGGGIESMAAARDEALVRLEQFFEQHGRRLPNDLRRDLQHALVLPHEAGEPGVAGLRHVRVGWARQAVLVYRHECPQDWPRSEPGGVNALPAFASLAGQPGEKPFAPVLAAATRAVVRGALSQLLARNVASAGFGGRGGAFADQLAGVLAPIWGGAVGRDAIERGLQDAAANLMTDLLWGEYVPPTYVDELGLAQLLSVAVARLPDQRELIFALIDGNRRAGGVLAGAVLEVAGEMRAGFELANRRS